MATVIYKEEVYRIIGACMEVHTTLGHGFHETVYHEAACLEFEESCIPFKREVNLAIRYKEKRLEKYYVADFICYNSIIVEFKACSSILDAHMGQVINYLKATGFKLGVLVNFGNTSLAYKRIVL